MNRERKPDGPSVATVPYPTVPRHWRGALFQQRSDQSFAWMSEGVAELTGVPAARWLADTGVWQEVVHPDDRKAVKAHWREGRGGSDGSQMRFRFQHAVTGRVVWVEEHRVVVAGGADPQMAYEGVWVEATRQVQAERRLAAAAWQEALAALALGMAHDFNNVLTGVISLSGHFLSQIDAQHPFHEGLELLLANARNCSQTIQRVGLLYQAKPGLRALQDLNALVRETAEVLGKAVSRRHELDVQLAEEALPVLADGVLLRRAIFMLALRAVADATGAGKFVFTTARRSEASGDARGPKRSLVGVGIVSQGQALEQTDAARACDPLAPGNLLRRQGGLTLHAVAAFAQANGGRVELPRSGETPSAVWLWMPEPPLEGATAEEATGPRDPQWVLLWGPKAPDLTGIAQALRAMGLQVVIAEEGVDEVLASEDYHVDAVVALPVAADAATDDFVARARLHRPGATILVAPQRGSDHHDLHGLSGQAEMMPAGQERKEWLVERLARWRAGA